VNKARKASAVNRDTPAKTGMMARLGTWVRQDHLGRLERLAIKALLVPLALLAPLVPLVMLVLLAPLVLLVRLVRLATKALLDRPVPPE